MTVSVTVAPGATSPILSMQGISKRYGPTQARLGIDLAAHPGKVNGLVGGNGVGKSTLMKILCGVVAPTDGTITAGDAVIRLDGRWLGGPGRATPEAEITLERG